MKKTTLLMLASGVVFMLLIYACSKDDSSDSGTTAKCNGQSRQTSIEKNPGRIKTPFRHSQKNYLHGYIFY